MVEVVHHRRGEHPRPRLEESKRGFGISRIPTRHERPTQRLNHGFGQEPRHRISVVRERRIRRAIRQEKRSPRREHLRSNAVIPQRVPAVAQRAGEQRLRVTQREIAKGVRRVLIRKLRQHLAVHRREMIERGTPRRRHLLALLRRAKERRRSLRRRLPRRRLLRQATSLASKELARVSLVANLRVRRLNLRLGEVDDEAKVVLQLREGELLSLLRSGSAPNPEAREVRHHLRLPAPHVDDGHLRGLRGRTIATAIGAGVDQSRGFRVSTFLFGKDLLRGFIFAARPLHLVATFPHRAFLRLLRASPLRRLPRHLVRHRRPRAGNVTFARLLLLLPCEVLVVELARLLEVAVPHPHRLGPHLRLHGRRHPPPVLPETLTLLVPHLLQQFHADALGVFLEISEFRHVRRRRPVRTNAAPAIPRARFRTSLSAFTLRATRLRLCLLRRRATLRRVLHHPLAEGARK